MIPTLGVAMLVSAAAGGAAVPSASMSLSSVQAAWRGGKVVAIEEPQGFRIGLIDTGLLGELNRYRWAPRGTGRRFDIDSVSRVYVGSNFVMAFDRRTRLRFAMLRYSVPVDTRADQTNRWSPKRLHRRTDTLARLKAELPLRPSRRDRFGNVFEWESRQQKTWAKLRYDPVSDEMILLIRY